MEIQNVNLLTPSEVKTIEEICNLPLELTHSLIFNISQIVRPNGNTRVVIERKKDPEKTELVNLNVSQKKIDTIKKKLIFYYSKCKEAHIIYTETSIKISQKYQNDVTPIWEQERLKKLERQIQYWSELENSNKELLDILISNNGKPYKHTFDTLGEYIQEDDCIKLYIDTISDYNRETTLFYTLVHELFHAFYYNHGKNTNFPVVKEIDEAMVEFGMLTYLNNLRTNNTKFDIIFDDALNAVKKKQQSIGLTPSYGFGAFVFENCNRNNLWIAQYFGKYRLIDNQSKDVLSYVDDLHPLYTNDERMTFLTLSRILFDGEVVDCVRRMPCNRIKRNVVDIDEIHRTDDVDSQTYSPTTSARSYNIKFKNQRDNEWKFGVYPDIVFSNPLIATRYGYPIPFRKYVNEIEFLEGVERIEPESFRGYNRLLSVKLSSTIKIIEEEAFRDCHRLTTIDLGDSVTILGDGVFYNCEHLENVHFSPNLIVIGERAFCGCLHLENVDIPDSVVAIQNHAFCCSGMKEIKLSQSLSILGKCVFERCFNLSHIVLPDSLHNIEVGMFDDCSALETVKMPSNLLYISPKAFISCTSLTKIELPKILLSIGNSAFENSGLTEIDIPKFVNKVGACAFADCKHLSIVSVYRTTEVLKDAFPNDATVIYL